MVLLSTMPTQAVPARRGPITMLQPDGKTITVLLLGIVVLIISTFLPQII